MKKIIIAAATVAVAALALSGCSGGSTAKKDTTLTIALASAPISLDPSKAAVGLYTNYVDPTYASLLNRANDGKIIAGLADKWGYKGTGNKKFEVHLRSGLKFADGTPLTAKDVVASIEYFRTGSGGGASYYKAFTFATPDTHTVDIISPVANPSIPDLLLPENLGGAIISPAGLKNPTKLASGTYGAGQYVYSAAKSVTNDHYVFTPNKYYWDQQAIHYKSITIRVIANVNSQLAALRSGQIDFMAGNADVAAAVKGSATIVTKTQPSLWAGLYLLDRNGQVVPAMKDVRVRQALNYAVDRAAITKAVYGAYGQPVDQPAVPGFDGYDKSLESRYPYDPAKAKKLLAAAGFGSGLTIPVNYGSFDPDNTKMVQAVQDQLSKVGVTLQLTASTNFGGWVGDLVSKKFAATILSPGAGGGSAYGAVQSTFLPTGIMNLYGVESPEMTAAFNALSTVDAAGEAAAARKTTKIAVDQALSLPISTADTVILYNKKLQNVTFPLQSSNPTYVTQWDSK